MKILIIKTSSLGDIVQTFPVINYLKTCFPKAEIDWIVEKKAEKLVSAHPKIDHVFAIDSKKWKRSFFKKRTWQEIKKYLKEVRKSEYDVVFDFQGNVKSSLLLFSVKAKKKVGFSKPAEFPNRFFTNVKVKVAKDLPIQKEYLSLCEGLCQSGFDEAKRAVSLKLTAQEKRELKSILKGFDSQYKVLVASFAFWPNKELKIETLYDLLEKLQKEKECHFFFISSQKREHLIALKLANRFKENATVLGSLTMPLLQNVMKEMDLVLAMDSFPLHLAQTTSTSCFGIFGPSSGKKFLSFGENDGFYQAKCPYGKTFEKRCKNLRNCKSGACLKELKSESLYEVLCNFLKR